MTIHTANPLMGAYSTPCQTPPFHLIAVEHYEPAFREGIAQHDAEIAEIANSTEIPTFANTVEAYERSGKLLSKVCGVFFNLLSAETNDQMMEIARQMSPVLADHSNNIHLNEPLFQRIRSVYENRHSSGLSAEQIRLTEKIFQSFEDSGAMLSLAQKEEYRQLSTELSRLTLEFGQNTLKETNAYELHLTDEADLAGLPSDVRQMARTKATEKGYDGWLFGLSAPEYIAFMKYAENRNLRQKLYTAFATKCVNGGEFDNQENVRQIANLRLRLARLMGYPDYATYALRDTMAQNKEQVFKLLGELKSAFATLAYADVQTVKAYAQSKEGGDFDLQTWDWSFYAEKLKDEAYSVNDELVRPYFELENVKRGVFGLATSLYGITFRRNSEIPVYHPEVEAFEVFDHDGRFLAVLYTDFHPRDSKRQGAWMTEFKGQFKENGTDSRPHISLVMNFTRPTEGRPALLTFDEVETFLHEFGHGLHGMLTNCTYETLSGTNVPRDFVELPSQIMENWLTQSEFLDRFATHFETGEKMPAELVKRLADAANYNAGYLCYRQLSFGYLDMAWHTLTEAFDGDVRRFEADAVEAVRLLPTPSEACVSTAFGHIFSGGYAAGYYSYKWSEVLDADAFSLFRTNGIFDRTTAQEFRKNILERGNTDDPMRLYERFRKRQPSVDALLKRSGVSG